MRQSIQNLVRAAAARPEASALLSTWPELAEEVIAEALTIQAIPAPTFDEQARAAYVEASFSRMRLDNVEHDSTGNVYARTPGSQSKQPALMIGAHLDTVFPADTDLGVRRYQNLLYGPGLGDNSLGLAAMLALARNMHRAGLAPATDIWWVATVGEEGLGDLRGMRRALERLGGLTGLVIVLEGIGLGRVYHAGLGVRRLRVTVTGPGGHSWLHADRPSAIHHLLRLGAALVEEITPGSEPRASFNIGLISGGRSINTRAPQASLAIDLRAQDAATLVALEAEVMEVVARFSSADGLAISSDVIGDRPGATLLVTHPLVQAAQETLRYLGHDHVHTETGSTDANIPLAMGIPAVCIGITSGGDAHTTQEFIDTRPVATGMQQLTLLALLAAQHVAAWKAWDAG